MTFPASSPETCHRLLAGTVPATPGASPWSAPIPRWRSCCPGASPAAGGVRATGQDLDDLTGLLDVIVIADLGAVADPRALLTSGRRRRRPGRTGAAAGRPRPVPPPALGPLPRLSPPVGFPGVPTVASVLQLLLDGGFAPQLRETVPDPCLPELLDAFGPLWSRLGLYPGHMTFLANSAKMLFQAVPEPDTLVTRRRP